MKKHNFISTFYKNKVIKIKRTLIFLLWRGRCVIRYFPKTLQFITKLNNLNIHLNLFISISTSHICIQGKIYSNIGNAIKHSIFKGKE